MAHSDLQDTLAALDALELRRYALRYGMISALWLAETADPAACAHNRGEAMATLQEDDRQLLCGEESQAIVTQLEAHKSQLDFFRAAQLRVMDRDQQEQLRIPAPLAGRIARLTNEATDAWKRAKQKDCWDDFAPYLDQLVAASKEMAVALNPEADPYDTLLDLFEHGTSRAFYNAFFDQLKATVVPLVAAVTKAPQLSNECVRGYFDPAVQWELSRDLATSEGVDPQKLVLGQTEHPFSDAIDSQHVFIATHIYPDDLLSNVFSMLHEGGHAMYEAGVDPAYDLTCLHGGTSMGMHEAQSRFFENLVGRDLAFAKPLLALLTSHFPEQLASVTPDEFFLAANRVEPSLVRTEADELTYPLHVMVRFEIEKQLFDGSLTAAQVPEVWAQLYRSYLGVEVPDNRRGALQDVHWSQASFGYFPTYALGSAYGAQLLHALKASLAADGTSWEEVLASGNLAPVRAWLKDHIWRWGRAKEPAELILEATGEPFDARFYCDYLAEKYTRLYSLNPLILDPKLDGNHPANT